MNLKPLRTAQPAVRGGPPLDGDLYRWLASLMTAVQLAVPPKGIVMANLTSAEVAANFDGTGLGNSPGKYEGWAICNGSNGTPNLDERFVRAQAAGAGATGGSDSSPHTHAIDHNHGSFTSGEESSHTHDGEGLRAHINLATAANQVRAERVDYEFAATHEVTGSSASTTASNEIRATAVGGTTAAGSAHSHAVDVPALTGTSGAASATENRPAYYELVPLMRLEIA